MARDLQADGDEGGVDFAELCAPCSISAKSSKLDVHSEIVLLLSDWSVSSSFTCRPIIILLVPGVLSPALEALLHFR